MHAIVFLMHLTKRPHCLNPLLGVLIFSQDLGLVFICQDLCKQLPPLFFIFFFKVSSISLMLRNTILPIFIFLSNNLKLANRFRVMPTYSVYHQFHTRLSHLSVDMFTISLSQAESFLTSSHGTCKHSEVCPMLSEIYSISYCCGTLRGAVKQCCLFLQG